MFTLLCTTSRKAGLSSAICGILLLLAACVPDPAQKYAFRLTVEVETPNGIRRGSSVYLVTAQKIRSILPDAAKRDWTVVGDAVAVDLPGKQTLFALRETHNPLRPDLARVSMAALDPAFKNDIVESATRLSRRSDVRPRAVLAREDYPLLAAFKENTVAKTVTELDPDNLKGQFGPGVRLKQIWVELTDDPPTLGISKRLPWLGDTGRALDSRFKPTASPTFSQRLHHSAFWSGA